MFDNFDLDLEKQKKNERNAFYKKIRIIRVGNLELSQIVKHYETT